MKLPATDRLDAKVLGEALADCVIGREIVVLDQTTSTNDAILQRAVTGEKEGLVIFAEKQTAGRGQRDNVWESVAHKGLWFSILLQPNIEIAQSAELTQWCAQSVAQAIAQEFDLTPTIKQPNDVYVGGKKVAGVLMEMRARKQAPHLAIAGIGVNVNHSREDFSPALRGRATSIAQLLNRAVDRQQMAVVLLRNLDRTYRASFKSQHPSR